MPPTLIQQTGKAIRLRPIHLVALTVSALCGGCQSLDSLQSLDSFHAFNPTPRFSVDRSPRLVAGLHRTSDPIAMPVPVYDGTDIWARMGQGFSLASDREINERIVRQREWLLERPGFLREASQRASPYLHFIVERLDERKMPSELALLPMIESAYNPKARSPKDAAGLWQFMAATGRDFNLRQTAWYDGRRDLMASSKAAMDYLSRLHEQFGGDWLLAMAAYNAGEGTVARAIQVNQRQGLSTDYWHLNLPRETQDYVPRLLALSQLVRDPQLYGVRLSPVSNTPYLAVISLAHPVDLSQLAARAGIDEASLLRLNSAFLRKKTVDGPAQLLVPQSQAQQVSASLLGMQTEPFSASGEALATGARPPSALASAVSAD